MCSGVDFSIFFISLAANSSEKPKIKKVELKKKKKKKKMAEEINSSPVDSKLSEKLKKRKVKGSNVDISKQSQPKLEGEFFFSFGRWIRYRILLCI